METYTIEINCKNCGKVSTKEIEKGKERDDREDCPNCGNMAGTNTYKEPSYLQDDRKY